MQYLVRLQPSCTISSILLTSNLPPSHTVIKPTKKVTVDKIVQHTSVGKIAGNSTMIFPTRSESINEAELHSTHHHSQDHNCSRIATCPSSPDVTTWYESPVTPCGLEPQTRLTDQAARSPISRSGMLNIARPEPHLLHSPPSPRRSPSSSDIPIPGYAANADRRIVTGLSTALSVGRGHGHHDLER